MYHDISSVITEHRINVIIYSLSLFYIYILQSEEKIREF